MLCCICDTHFEIILDHNKSPEYFELDYSGNVLTHMEGMFGTIATITNFMMQFLNNNTVLGFCVIIFRRLYNFFPHYRNHLEQPIVILLSRVLVVHKLNLTQGKDPRMNEVSGLTFRLSFDVIQHLYEASQKWFNFLIDSKFTDK